MWSILWDLYDNNADANDTVELGFQPMWNVLIGSQRTTPAFTSLFSFITALKTASPVNAAAIDTLVTAQNTTRSPISGARGRPMYPRPSPRRRHCPCIRQSPSAGHR